MVGKSAVGFCDKLLVETHLATARLVACDHDDGVPLRIECEGHMPFAVRGREPHLLHVCVLRAFERVDLGPTEPRTEFGEQLRDGQKFGLNPALERQKLRFGGVVKSASQLT